jgi:hypothetical protein
MLEVFEGVPDVENTAATATREWYDPPYREE